MVHKALRTHQHGQCGLLLVLPFQCVASRSRHSEPSVPHTGGKFKYWSYCIGEAVAEILACGRSEPVVPGSIPGCDELGFFVYRRVE